MRTRRRCSDPALKGQWSESAVRVLRERYLWKKDGQFLEDEDGLCWRVATAVAQAETNYGGDVYAVASQFYEVLVSGKFLANSPTLMNAGKDNGLQLSACFVLPVEDTIEGIFDAVKYAAIIHKSGGGTGFSFSRLRPEGSTVGTSQGVASGPVSFMRIFDAATEQVKQGGTRRGANMGILRVDHPDVEKFITCKLDGGVTNFNISVAATDVFMQAVKDDTEYDLIEPHSGAVVGRKRAREVWDQIVDAAWRSGDPGFVFIDRANNSKSNPTPKMELLEATNPCGEQWLGPYDACNLGSINLAATTKRIGETVFLDWEELERVTRLTVRFLDDVIDVNPLPLPQIQEKVRANRRIGLGVMGWADLLFLLNIPYDSDEALTLGTEIMARIEEWGWSASRDLAVERGPFPNFAESIYANDAPVRNGTVTTVAPTGSISILADCSSGIEPIFALAFQHRVKQGKEYRILNFVNPIFKAEMERRGLWSEELEQHLIATGSVKGAPGMPGGNPARLRHGAGDLAGMACAPAGRLAEARRQLDLQDRQSAERRHPRGCRRGIPERLRYRLQGHHRLPRRLQERASAQYRRQGEESGSRTAPPADVAPAVAPAASGSGTPTPRRSRRSSRARTSCRDTRGN